MANIHEKHESHVGCAPHTFFNAGVSPASDKVRGAHPTTGMINRLLPALSLLLTLGCPSIAYAAAPQPTVAVIYPEVREPFKAVFMEVIRGIETSLNQPVKHYVLSDRDDASDALLERMQADHVDVAVSLGRAGLLATKQLAQAFPVVIGAVLVSPGQETKGLSGISLTPDPDVLFERLKMMVPDAKEVTVIFDPRQKAWEIEYARKAAAVHRLTLNALPSEDLRLSAELFRSVLVEIEDGSICLWLPQDNAAMDEQALLPMVLQEAWEKNFVVFSSNLEHVRKGALFSLYPDNFGMGRSLAMLALDRLQKGAPTAGDIKPLRDLRLAVNLRTAQHLGLSFASRDRQSFDLVFPTP